jgi:hypothetical protein
MKLHLRLELEAGDHAAVNEGAYLHDKFGHACDAPLVVQLNTDSGLLELGEGLALEAELEVSSLSITLSGLRDCAPPAAADTGDAHTGQSAQGS